MRGRLLEAVDSESVLSFAEFIDINIRFILRRKTYFVSISCAVLLVMCVEIIAVYREEPLWGKMHRLL